MAMRPPPVGRVVGGAPFGRARFVGTATGTMFDRTVTSVANQAELAERYARPSMLSKAGWSARETRIRSLRGLKAGGIGIGIGLNLAFAPAIIGGSALSEGARWGTKTGFQEDYIGGFASGLGQGGASAAGGFVGELIGAALGAPFGPLGVGVGQIAGNLIGFPLAQFFTQRRNYEKGRMASYAAAGAIAKHKVQFGRGFRDTEEAYTMRQMAVQEMAGSLLNARQYLGNEAFFLHR